MAKKLANDWYILDTEGKLPKIGEKIIVAISIGEDVKHPVFDRIWETIFLPEMEDDDIKTIVQLWLRHEQRQYDEKIIVFWQPTPPQLHVF